MGILAAINSEFHATPRNRMTDAQRAAIIAAHLDRLNITARDRVLIEGARQGRAALQFADRERVKAILAPVRDSIAGQEALWADIQSRAIGGSSPA